MKPGTLVGNHRWPYHGSHPDCWGVPWSGVVLRRDDPMAWNGSLAFGVGPSDPKAVAAHVEKHAGLLADTVPVLWDFGGHSAVYWERVYRLRPYDEDVAEWELERAEAKECWLRREAA